MISILLKIKPALWKGGKEVKGQIATAALIVFVFAIVAIGLILFILTQVKKPPSVSVTSPASVSVTSPGIVYSQDPATYVKDTQAKTPTHDAEVVKAQILTNAGIPLVGGAGVVTTQPNFQIGWVSGPNVFMVEIRSSNLEGAKAEAEQWLVNQGFTPQDFCQGIAVTFYINSEIRKSLPAGTIFDPIPSCR